MEFFAISRFIEVNGALELVFLAHFFYKEIDYIAIVQ
jgi:hypothetical protein